LETHCTHALFTQYGDLAEQSPSPAHCTHEFVVVSHTGRAGFMQLVLVPASVLVAAVHWTQAPPTHWLAPGQLLFVVHSMQLFVVVLQYGVGATQVVSSVHATQVPVAGLQAGAAAEPPASTAHCAALVQGVEPPELEELLPPEPELEELAPLDEPPSPLDEPLLAPLELDEASAPPLDPEAVPLEDPLDELLAVASSPPLDPLDPTVPSEPLSPEPTWLPLLPPHPTTIASDETKPRTIQVFIDMTDLRSPGPVRGEPHKV